MKPAKLTLGGLLCVIGGSYRQRIVLLPSSQVDSQAPPGLLTPTGQTLLAVAFVQPPSEPSGVLSDDRSRDPSSRLPA